MSNGQAIRKPHSIRYDTGKRAYCDEDLTGETMTVSCPRNVGTGNVGQYGTPEMPSKD